MKNATNHWAEAREARDRVIKELLGGDGEPIATVAIDRGNPLGAEIHTLTDNGVIVITGERTGKVITKLIARPGQCRKFFPNGSVPIWLWKLAKDHTDRCYNQV